LGGVAFDLVASLASFSLHCPFGRVGLSGPERAIRLDHEYAATHGKKTLRGRSNVRPSRKREGDEQTVTVETKVSTQSSVLAERGR